MKEEQPATPAAPAAPTAAELRASELAECVQVIRDALKKYGATYSVGMVMTVDRDGRPLVSYSVGVTDA